MWKFKKVTPRPPSTRAGAADRGGDVVQLQVREHGQVQRAQSLDRLRTGRGVELETDLGDAEPRRDRRARRTASSRSGTSSASARRLRTSLSIEGEGEGDDDVEDDVDVMASDSSGEITNACDVVIGAPSAHFGGNPQRRTRLEERSGPDADRVRAGEQHLGRVATAAYAAGTDDRRVRERAAKPPTPRAARWV